MADVSNSSARSGRSLANTLRNVVASTQRQFAPAILSPITITLGDEFQTVVATHRAMVEIIFHLEYMRLQNRYGFRLHYSMSTGEIETAINTEIAHEMIGPALTVARKRLTEKSRNRRAVAVSLPDDALANTFENLFSIALREMDAGSNDERRYLHDLISDMTNTEIAARHNRHASVISKKRRGHSVQSIMDARSGLLSLAEIADRLEDKW